VTPIRVSVIELLLSQSCALSAADVLGGLRAEAPDRVTIYRTLSALTECGLIRQEMNFDKVRRYVLVNPVAQSWIKFRCVVCGAERTRRAELLAAEAFPGCEITGQTLLVEGRCEECRGA
jgi:Fe2+ or Zn2+ uptake regulation protein